MLCKRIESLTALGVDQPLVCDQVLKSDSAVRADLVERDLPAFQQLHEEGSRDVEHLRRVLGRQLGVDRDDADSVAFSDFGQDVDQQP